MSDYKEFEKRRKTYAVFLLGWMAIGAVAFAVSLIFAK